MDSQGYTKEMAEEQEIEGILDALGYDIELNDEFLDRFVGKEVREQLKRVPKRDRGYYLSSNIDEKACYFNGTVATESPSEIWIDVNEIEIQFEGKAEEFFACLDDWYIPEGGSLAYLYVGYGLSIPVNVEGLKEDIDEGID